MKNGVAVWHDHSPAFNQTAIWVEDPTNLFG